MNVSQESRFCFAVEYDHEIEKIPELKKWFFKLNQVVSVREGDYICKDILMDP